MFSEKWTLHSNTAVRVSLMCQNTLLPDGTLVFIRRRLRDGGRRVRVGGCPRNRPKGSHLRPTLRFAANATGEISEWENSFIGLGAGVCPDTPETQRLTSAQGIGGSISSPSSAVEGLVLRLRLAPPAGTMHYPQGCPPVQLLLGTGARRGQPLARRAVRPRRRRVHRQPAGPRRRATRLAADEPAADQPRQPVDPPGGTLRPRLHAAIHASIRQRSRPAATHRRRPGPAATNARSTTGTRSASRRAHAAAST